jgi:DNA-binding IscR family transcriptional regulator
MPSEGDYQTLEEIAAAENTSPSYVSRVLRMTLLAPEIVETILAGSLRG